MLPENQHLSQRWVVHPFLWGLLPPLWYFSASLPWVGLDEVLLPAGTILGLSAALWLMLWPILPDPRKRGVALALYWIPFYGYGALVDGIREQFDFHRMLDPVRLVVILFAALLLGLGCLYALRRTRRTFTVTTFVLNRLSIALLGVAVATSALALLRQEAGHTPRAGDPPAGTASDEQVQLPNIYFILCDGYPRSDYLNAYFEYDNTAFLEGLRERGFFVANKSRSNYPNTLPSLASSFNMEYLDNALAVEGWDGNYPKLMTRIRDSAVFETLQARGVELVVIASALFPRAMKRADRFIEPPVTAFTEYQQFLIDLTPIRSLLNRMEKTRWHHRVPFVLEAVETVRSAGRPMFVYAHVLAPHLPHSYDEHGNVLKHFPPYKQGWRQVTTFLDTRLIQIVDRIREKEPNSVIIIQGDHGPNTTWQNPFTMEKRPWEGSWDAYVLDRTAILYAIYLPDGDYSGGFHDAVTPVNTFRILFNKYLETNYSLLEDVTYLSPQNSAEIIRVDGEPE